MSSNNSADFFVRAPATLNAVYHEDYRSSCLEVYISIASRAGTAPNRANYCTCFPNLDTIAGKFKHSRPTVLDAIRWLERKGYLYCERRTGSSNLYTIVLKRDEFLKIAKGEGIPAARLWYSRWILEQWPQ